MTLKEKIAEAKNIAKRLQEANPDITDVWFEFKDLPVSEVEDLAKEQYSTPDVLKRGGKDVLRFLARNTSPATIFCFSNPVKVVEPKYIIEEITT